MGGTAQFQQPSGLPVRGVTPLRELALDQVRSKELMLGSSGGQAGGAWNGLGLQQAQRGWGGCVGYSGQPKLAGGVLSTQIRRAGCPGGA